MKFKNEEINDLQIEIRKKLEEQIVAEYGEDALLEDGKNFTKDEVMALTEEVFRSKEENGG